MESAKKTKLFLDLETKAIAPGEGNAFAAFGESKVARFVLSSAFWETIERDPELYKEYNRRVEARALEMVRQEDLPQAKKIMDVARAEGFQKGLEEGRAELRRIADGLLLEKEMLLHEHEKIWCQAVGHIFRRFLVPMSAERLAGLSAWLEDAIGDFRKQARIEVAVSSKVYSEVTRTQWPDSQWTWLEDKTLPDTDMRIHLEGGGVIFSAKNEWEKFELKLNEVLGVAKQ